MPAQKRSNDSLFEDEEDAELQRNNQNDSEESENDDVEQADSDDDESFSSTSSDVDEDDEFVYVTLADVRKDVQCPICLGIIRKTRKAMECLHRFCRECIDKSMRLGNNECPACRAHCASRRSLRDDPIFDALIAMLYPDIDKYEEELTFGDEEKDRNKQIQESIAQISRRQLEALGKKRANAKATATAVMRRSQTNTRNLRGRKRKRSAEPQGSDNEVDAGNDYGGKYSSSTDEPDPEPVTEVKPKRYKRWSGGPSSLPSSSAANGGCDEDEPEGSRKTVGASVGLFGNPEILAWGRGGMRSHTRHGSQSGGSGKTARNSQLSKLIDHLQKLRQNDDKLEIHLKLVSFDEQNMPNLQNLYVCCKPTMSATNVCQYVALENGLRADEIELLLVKGGHSERDPAASSSVSPAEQSVPIAINPLTDELQLLEENQILSDLARTSSQNDLTIAYRKKSHSY